MNNLRKDNRKQNQFRHSFGGSTSATGLKPLTPALSASGLSPSQPNKLNNTLGKPPRPQKFTRSDRKNQTMSFDNGKRSLSPKEKNVSSFMQRIQQKYPQKCSQLEWIQRMNQNHLSFDTSEITSTKNMEWVYSRASAWIKDNVLFLVMFKIKFLQKIRN